MLQLKYCGMHNKRKPWNGKWNKERKFPKSKKSFYEHWKPGGVFMSQALRTKPIDTGKLRLNPRTLALIAVHRQTAASASTSPPKSLQQGFLGGIPTWAPSRPPSTLLHAPNLIASLGQVPDFRDFGNADGGLTRGSGKAGGRFGNGGLEGSGKRGGYCIGGFESDDIGGEVGELDLWLWCL